MLCRFEFILKCETGLANANFGSLMHGALMEMIPEDYALKLHENQLKPFSQYVRHCDEGIRWVVNCLNDESAQCFSSAFIRVNDNITLNAKNRNFDIVRKTMNSISYKQLIDDFYSQDAPKYQPVRFLTPTSSKKNGMYMIFPDLASIFGSLIRKFDAFSGEYTMYDEDMFRSILENTDISSYELRSTVYHMESVKIPSFMGRITIKNNGPSQLGRFIRLLLKFGEYSGIGIKTALGMGAAETEEVIKIAKR